MMPNRSWLQFSLRSCLLLTTAVCIWLGWHARESNRRREAVDAIANMGGEAIDFDQRAMHKFYVLFKPTSSVEWPQLSLTDEKLPQVCRLQNIWYMSVEDAPISDAGLKHLHGLNRLRRLGLTRTHVTAAGVAELQKALPNCEIVWDAKLHAAMISE